MKKLMIIAYLAMIFMLQFLVLDGMAADKPEAVESVGEINAKDNSTGTVIAGETAELILTLIADMSQAEPGEEIYAIRILLPQGFNTRENAVNHLTIGGEELPDFTSVVDNNMIFVSFPDKKEIRLTAIAEIGFTVDAPVIPSEGLFFIVSLININQNPIIVAIKEGNADGRLNNDKLSLKVVAATKPLPPKLLSVKPETSGENDIIIAWERSTDENVSGYLVYPSDRQDSPIDVPGRQTATYIDRNLKPGEEYSYTIRSYKTKKLVSDPSNSLSAVAPEDTTPPQAPDIIPEVELIEDGIKIRWGKSPSADVVNYIVYRGTSINDLESIAQVKPIENMMEYFYIDENPPTIGSFIYAVSAVDDTGKATLSSPTKSRQTVTGTEPQPNPFTPLSGRFNQVIFPASMLESEGAAGTFAVKIFDLEGDMVFEAEAQEGTKEIKWDGKDMNGEYVASGIYVYQATVGDAYKTGTIIVAR